MHTIAWIFYAIEMASSESMADSRSIKLLADGINHAVPTDREMQSSTRWLLNAGLIYKSDKKYGITPDGRSIFANANMGALTISKVWSRLTKELESLHLTCPNG